MALQVSPTVIVLAVFPAVLWGLTPVLDKRAMAAGGTPLQGLFWVVVVDTAVYWALLLYRQGFALFSAVSLTAVAVFVAAGVVDSAISRLIALRGTQRVGASITSAGTSVRPLFATAIALAWLGEPVTLQTAAGNVLVVGGLVVLAVSRGGDIGGWSLWDLRYPFVAAGGFAVGNVLRRFGLTRTTTTPLEAVTINETIALVLVGGYVAYATLRKRRAFPVASVKSHALFAASGFLTGVALLSLFAAFAARDGRVAIVDPLAATAPLFTLVFSALFLADLERVTRRVVAGAGLIVAGGALIAI